MTRSRKTVLLLVILFGLCAWSHAAPTGSITITGSEQPGDSGYITITLTVNGNNYVRSAPYGQYSTPDSIASVLAASITSDCYGPANAKSAPGGVIYFQARGGGDIAQISVNNNGSISFGSSGPGSGTMSETTTVATIGQSYLQQGNTTNVDVQVSCGTSCGTVDYRIDGGEWQTVALDGNGHFSAQTNGGWSVGLHNITVKYLGNGSFIPSGSNPVSLDIGTSPAGSNTIYSYNVTSYDATGNILAYNDLVNGSWTNIQYDGWNRLAAATGPGQSMCWSYDSFGNRLAQAFSSSPCSNPAPQVSYSANNQVQGFEYDAAGNVTFDGQNRYKYDAEGRVCAVQYPALAGLSGTMGYVYDAEGRRVAKGTISSFDCNFDPTNLNSFQETHGYQLGSNGEQIAETDSAGNWLHTNVFADGQLIATYDPSGVHFHLSDWLGTRRVTVSPDYINNNYSTSNYQTLPFGELVNSAQSIWPTEHLFTDKERDNESGLDYFGARYYASSMGRWMSPDWAEKPEAVPYSDLTNPQSFNLYGYVNNNPLAKADLDGHDFWDFVSGVMNATTTNAVVGLGRGTGNADYSLGQRVGDAISVVGGAIEMAGGGTIAGGGAAACATGVGCAAGAPAIVGGSALASHGALELGTAASHLLMEAKTGESGGPGAGKSIGNKTKAAALDENKASNGGQAKCVFCKEPVGDGTGNKINFDHAKAKAHGGTNGLNNVNVTCEYCNKSKGTGDVPKNPKQPQ